MSKRAPISLLLALSLTLLASCSPSGSGNKTTASPGRTDNGVIDVLFVGNSLTTWGEVPEKFALLSKSTNRTVNVLKKTAGGYSLEQHLAELKGNAYKHYFEEADIVVLQPFGSSGETTVNTILEMQSLFKPGAKFYIFLTENGMPQRVNDLKDIKNLTYIPSGYVHTLLLKDGFTFEQLHAADRIHPSIFYGYAAALTVYSVIYDTSCIGLSHNFMDGLTSISIPGDTAAEMDRTIDRVQELVMEAVNTDPADYK